MSKKSDASECAPDFVLKPGDRVIITANPHDPRAENVVGTVVVFRPGEGFGNSHLVDVHYKSPRDGKGCTMCFGLSCLGPATPDALIRLAEHHEAEAARLRSLVKAASGERVVPTPTGPLARGTKL